MSCNYEIKQHLLQMIEWNSKSVNGWDYDTRYDGRMIVDWAPPEIIDLLSETFASYDQKNLVKCLLASIELFERLSDELANNLGYSSSRDATKAIHELVKRSLTVLIQ